MVDYSSMVWVGAVVAVLFFWCVGLYSRLKRLHARALEALHAVEPCLQGYAALLQPGQAQWQAVSAALHAAQTSHQTLKEQPPSDKTLNSLFATLAAMQQAWGLLLAQPADLAGPAVPEQLQAAWESVTQQLHAVQQRFKRHADAYNEAIAQFPARLVARGLGFSAWPTLWLL